MRAPLEQFYSVQTPLFSLVQASVLGGMAQWVQRPTEKPGAILTQGRLLGVAREFFFQSTSNADSLTVSVQPPSALTSGAMQLWEHRDVGLYSYGNIEMWDYIAVGT